MNIQYVDDGHLLVQGRGLVEQGLQLRHHLPHHRLTNAPRTHDNFDAKNKFL